jgi:hypothetical protein
MSETFKCPACRVIHRIDETCHTARMVGGDRNSPMVELETRAAVAEAIVAVKGDFDPADLEPRFIEPPPVNTPPVVDDETAITEMAHFCTCPGDVGTNRLIKMNCPVHGLTFEALNGPDTGQLAAIGDLVAPHLGDLPDHLELTSKDTLRGRKVEVQFEPLRDKTSAERKAEPIHSGVLMYFPDALAAIARLSKAGNDKHNPGEPLHWARGKSMDQMDCLVRHSLTRDWTDQETQELEAVAMAWRALAELQLLEEARLGRQGIRPYSGVVPV